MKFIDTHTHIYAHEFDGDRTDVVRRAKEAGVEAILLPNEDVSSIDAMTRLCDEQPGFAYPMIGLHPTSVKADYSENLKKIERNLATRKYFGIGEIGIDLYWDKSLLNEQKEALEEQLRWSIDLNLPVSLHTRSSLEETLDCIYNVGADKLKGVFHCFVGTIEGWNEISKLPGFYVGIGGVVTFKKTLITETLPQIPIERIVLETDAPYLAPVPHRGSRNEPAFITYTAKKIAECYKTTVEKVSEATVRNSLKLFNIQMDNIDNEKL